MKEQKEKNILKKTTKSTYDWFRNSPNVSGPNNKSNVFNWKTIWRFVKIFIYLFLFSCTATGCVQIMVIQSDTQVGKGVELYNSPSKIPPHVTIFNLKDNKGIYQLEVNPRRILIKEQKELDAIHEEIKKQGLEMTDAYNGVNESFIIHGNGLKDNLQENKVEVFGPNNRPAILSSSFLRKGSEEQKEEKAINADYLFENFNSTKDLKVGNNSFFDELNGKKIIDKIGKDKKEIKITSNAFSLSSKITDKTREQFSLGFMQILFNKQLKNNETFGQWIINALNDNKKSDEIKLAASTSLNTIFSYSGIVIDQQNGNKLTFTKNFMPAIGTSESTNYRPVATWGETWTRLGPFYGTFVYPISFLNSIILNSFGSLGGWETIFTMIIITVMIRLLIFGLGFKSILQQTKMQELSSKRASIEAKYAPYKGNKQMENRQKQETAQLYKKEGISPLGQILNMLLSMPFFLSVWRVTNSNPQIKSTVWLGVDFSATSYQKLFSGELQYLPIIIFAALFSLGQQLVPRLLANRRNKNQMNVHQKQAMKKNNRVQNIMMIVFVFMAVAFNAGIQVYWIISGSWMILQGFFTHYLFIKQKQRSKRKKLGL